MKYKLKRDLPFAKAGDEVSIDNDSGYVYVFNSSASKGRFYIGHNHLILLHKGWIEEVKPREWYFLVSPTGYTTCPFEGLEELKKLTYWDKDKVIKVREVIE